VPDPTSGEETTVGPDQRPIVVGIDGSRAAEHAARWAAEQARDREAPLQLVHALTWPYEGAAATSDRDRNYQEGMRSGAEQLLGGLADALGTVLPRERISWRIEQGDPVAALCADAVDAEAIVVGGRGIGGVAGLLIGSTATGVAMAARCPVVVLTDESLAVVSGRRSVVVGVEGRGRDGDVLAFAFAEAAARGTDLVAVHAWADAVVDAAIRSMSPLLDWADVAADEQRLLAESLAGWREKEPDVTVREVVVRDRPAAALVAVGLTAELLVVGRTERGRLRRLGSATHGVLHRAGCPVAVGPVASGAGAVP
jgi:nucleotide-binding universal stress UspA family protein